MSRKTLLFVTVLGLIGISLIAVTNREKQWFAVSPTSGGAAFRKPPSVDPD